MQIVTLFTLAIGKFLNGVFVTIVHISVVKMINETIPVNLLQIYGIIVSSAMAFGYFLVLGFGFILPD